LKNGRSSQRFPVRALLLVPVCAAGGGEGRERERVRPPSPRLPRFFSGRYLPGVRPALLAAPAARSGLVELVDSFRKQRGVGRSSQGRPVSWSLWCFLLPFCSAPFKDSRLPGVLLVSSPHLVSLVRLRFRFRFVHVFVAYLIISPLLFLS